MRESTNKFKLTVKEVEQNLVANFYVDAYNSGIVEVLIRRHLKTPCQLDVEKRVMSTHFTITGPAQEIRSLTDVLAREINALLSDATTL